MKHGFSTDPAAYATAASRIVHQVTNQALTDLDRGGDTDPATLSLAYEAANVQAAIGMVHAVNRFAVALEQVGPAVAKLVDGIQKITAQAAPKKPVYRSEPYGEGAPSPHVTRRALERVGVRVEPFTVLEWTEEQRRDALEWARAEQAGQPDGHAIARPPFLPHGEPLPARQVADLLSLVPIRVDTSDIEANWDADMRERAAQWASLTHLAASDNDVTVPPRPGFLDAYLGERTRVTPLHPTLVHQVLHGVGVKIPVSDVRQWSPEQRWDAVRWAEAVDVLAADDPDMPERPAFLPPKDEQ